MDGASRLRVLWDELVVPSVWPGVLVTAVFCFIPTWNGLLFALILTRDDAVTLPVGITRFRTERGELRGPIVAAGILISVPISLPSAVAQRRFVRGLTGGPVKQRGSRWPTRRSATSPHPGDPSPPRSDGARRQRPPSA